MPWGNMSYLYQRFVFMTQLQSMLFSLLMKKCVSSATAEILSKVILMPQLIRIFIAVPAAGATAQD
eukprot:2042885-Amphidinium_carterae.1